MALRMHEQCTNCRAGQQDPCECALLLALSKLRNVKDVQLQCLHASTHGFSFCLFILRSRVVYAVQNLPHLAHWPVRLQEVGLQEGIEQVASDALYGIVNGQHVDALAVLHVRALRQEQKKISS